MRARACVHAVAVAFLDRFSLVPIVLQGGLCCRAEVQLRRMVPVMSGGSASPQQKSLGKHR